MKKKHVLIINGMIGCGGIGSYTLGLARGLKQRGNIVSAILTHGKGALYSEYTYAVDNIHAIESNSAILRYSLLLLYVWKKKPDFIIINFNGTSHILLPFFPASRIISVIHSAQIDFYRICKINQRFVNAWVAPSPSVATEFINFSDMSKSDSRVHLIAHGVDVSTYPRDKQSREIFNIVFVGALYQHKGVRILLNILSRLTLDCPKATLTIIGSGPEKSWLENSVCDQLRDKVTLTGQLTSTELKYQLSDMDVLLFPTRLEAFGLVIAESMAQGVVPVVSCLPGITDFIVEDGATGFLVEPDDIDGFVEALSKLYSRRDLLSDMSERCKHVAKERFSHEGMITAYCQLFENLSPRIMS